LGGKRELVLVAALSVESKERSVQPFYVADENLTFSFQLIPGAAAARGHKIKLLLACHYAFAAA
jgi:hypothetical protein